MGIDYFAVYCDSVKLADNMTFSMALLLVEAYFQKYLGYGLKLTIKRKEDEEIESKVVSERLDAGELFK